MRHCEPYRTWRSSLLLLVALLFQKAEASTIAIILAFIQQIASSFLLAMTNNLIQVPASTIHVFPILPWLKNRFHIFLHTTLSCTGLFTTAPIIPAARSAAFSSPSPKWAAIANPLFTTDMASAVLNVPDGIFIFDLPSSVTPLRSSLKMVTMRRISCNARGFCRQLHYFFKAFNPALYNINLFLYCSGSRKYNCIEATLHRTR